MTIFGPYYFAGPTYEIIPGVRLGCTMVQLSRTPGARVVRVPYSNRAGPYGSWRSFRGIAEGGKTSKREEDWESPLLLSSVDYSPTYSGI